MSGFVIYLRGLNTFGDDRLHLPPFVFGPMWQAFLKAFPRLHPVPGMGPRGPEGMALQAAEYLKAQGFLDGRPLVLFGHSTGGWAARLLAHHPLVGPSIRCIVTLGTPHRGAEMVDLALRSGPWEERAARLVRYDLARRRSIFGELATPNLGELNRKYPDLPQVPVYSLAGALAFEELSWVQQISAQRAGLRNTLSDGFFSLENQKWGQFVDHFGLEHTEEVGFSIRANPFARKRFRSEFQRLLESLEVLFRTQGEISPR